MDFVKGRIRIWPTDNCLLHCRDWCRPYEVGYGEAGRAKECPIDICLCIAFGDKCASHWDEDHGGSQYMDRSTNDNIKYYSGVVTNK